MSTRALAEKATIEGGSGLGSLVIPSRPQRLSWCLSRGRAVLPSIAAAATLISTAHGEDSVSTNGILTNAARVQPVEVESQRLEPIFEKMMTLRDLPEEKKATEVIELARRIHGLKPERLPTPSLKLELAVSLANFATEGDIGRVALQGAADTLEGVMRITPPITSTNLSTQPEAMLARLVHYKGATSSLTTEVFTNEIARLKEVDRKIETLDFVLKDLDGVEWRLKALLGKVVVVNFWATWCLPCLQELPHFEKLSERYKGEVHFLGLSDESPEVLRRFREGRKINYPILPDPNFEVGSLFGVESLPRTIVISRDGKVVAQAIDMVTMKQAEAMLKSAGLTSVPRN